MASDDEIEAAERMVVNAYDGWDPVPPAEVQRARDVFALRDIDAELATLVDELAAAEALEGARAMAPGVEHLTFGLAGLEIEVELTPDVAEDVVQLAGQVVPPSGGTVTAQPIDGPGVTAPIDELGRFLIRTPTGPTRLVVALIDRPRPIATEHFRA